MTDYITIKHETFTVALNLQELHRLPVPQWRKLLKMAVRQLWDNAGSLRLAMDWLDEAGIPGAEARLSEAEKDYTQGFRNLKGLKGLSDEEKDVIRLTNARLKSDLAEAKKRVQQLEKLRTIITETVPEDDLTYWINNF